MAAPKGNQFWKMRSKHGRDKIFSSPEIFLEAAYEYFEYCDNNPILKYDAIRGGNNAGELIKIPIQRPYSILGLCSFVHITHQTFRVYEKDENYKDFITVFTHIREIIEENQLSGATVGIYNANIVARKLGLGETIKQDLNIQSEIVVQDDETKELLKDLMSGK